MLGAFLISALGLVLPGTPARASVRMSIAVFGATGGVGGEAAFQALGRGESVRCLVRDKSRLKVPQGSGGASAGTPLVNEAMTVFEGTVTSASDVAKVFESGDVTGVHAPSCMRACASLDASNASPPATTPDPRRGDRAGRKVGRCRRDDAHRRHRQRHSSDEDERCQAHCCGHVHRSRRLGGAGGGNAMMGAASWAAGGRQYELFGDMTMLTGLGALRRHRFPTVHTLHDLALTVPLTAVLKPPPHSPGALLL